MTTTSTTTTKTLAMMPALSSKSTTISSIPVRAIPIPNTNKLILAGPCIVLRAATVAEQVQALRQSKKVTATTATLKTESAVEEPLRCKKRAGLGKLGLPEVKPSTSRRNARERNRVKLVNQGFDTLRQRVPGGKKNRKMSKVDTLKSAIDYIRHMEEVIREHDEKMNRSSDKPADNAAEKSALNNNRFTVNTSVPMSAEETVFNNNQRDENTGVPMPVESCVENKNVSTSLPVNVTSAPMETSITCVGALDNNGVLVTEKMNTDNIINNNNNTFVNFNMEKHEKGDSRQSETKSLNIGSTVKLDSVQKVNSEQVNQVNNVLLLNGVSAVSTTNIDTSSMLSLTSSVSTVTSMTPQTITLITLPLQQNVSLQQNLPYSSDDVFLTDSQQQTLTSSTHNAIAACRLPTNGTWSKTISSSSGSNKNNNSNSIRNSSGGGNNNNSRSNNNSNSNTGGNSSSRTGSISSNTAAAGNGTRLTTLRGLGSLSGQSFSLSQPCRRHLSFTEPEPDRPSSVQHKLLSEQIQTLLRIAQKQQQQEQLQQADQPQISFSLPPETSVPASEKSVDGNGATRFPSPTPMERQQLEDSQQNQEQPVYATLANVFLPNQSANAVLSLDQSTNTTSLSAIDSQTHRYQHLVAPGNAATRQAQIQVDQEVPSPSLSTSSSQTSESSYESYESLGSLEEDLQDLSDWITELCKSAMDMNGEGAADANCTDFLTYNHDLL